MQTAVLPFLIVYGAWFSILFALVAIVVSIWSLRRQSLLLARKQTQALLTELGPTTASPNFAPGGQAVLQGTLAMSGDSVLLCNLHSSPDAACQLEGTITLPSTSGSKPGELEAALWDTPVLLADARDALFAQARAARSVRLRGTLEPMVDTSKEVRGYREQALQWKLIGTPKAPLHIVPCPVYHPTFSARELFGAAVRGLFFFALVAGVLGWARPAWDSEPSIEAGTISYPLASQLPSVLPFHRNEALRDLSYHISMSRESTAMEHEIQLLLLQGECVSASSVALEAMHLGRARQLLDDCDAEESESYAYKVYLTRGEFELASQSLTDFWPRSLGWKGIANTHILAGDYMKAAATLEAHTLGLTERLATKALPGEDALPSPKQMRAELDMLECLASAMRTGSMTLCVQESEVSRFFREDIKGLLATSEGAPPKKRTWHGQPGWSLNPGDMNSIVRAGPLADLELNQGLLAAAYAGLEGKNDQAFLRGQIGLELAYWHMIFARPKVALHLAQQAATDLLSGLALEVPSFRQDLPIVKQDPSVLQNTKWSHLQWLLTVELLLAGLETERGMQDAARTHVETAKQLATAGQLAALYFERKDPIVDLPALLGKEATVWVGYSRDANDTLMIRPISPEYLDSGISDLLELRRRGQENTPSQQAELDLAIAAWAKALWDPKRSLYLMQLNIR